MPPLTPRTTRGRVVGPAGPAASLTGSTSGLGAVLRGGGGLVGHRHLGLGLRVVLLAGQEVLVDLAQGDGERLLLHVGVDERADVLQEALAELRVVGVDLAGALGS